jgi:hypothetical protein
MPTALLSIRETTTFLCLSRLARSVEQLLVRDVLMSSRSSEQPEAAVLYFAKDA